VGDPGALAQTVHELLRKGLTLGQILPPFTSNVARVLRLSGKGRLAVGTDADLVVLESDGRIRDVMANGRWHVEQSRAVIRGTFEEASR
jgi:beta-aspartyl-dipeptidase (metallo-type)